MPRKSRIEFAGAHYHVINRGNYKDWIFKTEGARRSFLECLKLCCEAQGWELHSWCLMSNHYHLLIHTPEPNLVEGMRWLQSTFANRFNRYRKVNGHVFQGRYKAILLDSDALGPVSHYIHLNPVRAGLVSVEQLQDFVDSSFHQMWHPRRRWSFCRFDCFLEAAGGLVDKPRDRVLYRDYLAWLSSEPSERKRLGFENMVRGWVKGSRDFKQAVLKDLSDAQIQKVVEFDAAEMREPRWERAVIRALESLGRTDSELRTEAKGAEWKVAVARHLRERCLTPNRWIAERLNMGATSSVQSLVSRHRKQKHGKNSNWILLNHEKLD